MGVTVSVDTFYASVAQAAIDAGAHIINDVSGGRFDPKMFATLAKNPNVAYCLMHSRADPKTMQQPDNLVYSAGVVSGVAEELQSAALRAHAAGVSPWQLWLDPGVGFAKTHTQCAELTAGVDALRARLRGGALQRAPVLVGASRKGFLNTAAGGALPRPDTRDAASGAASAIAAAAGANVLRMHDAAEGASAVAVGAFVRRAQRSAAKAAAVGRPGAADGGVARATLRECGAFDALDESAEADPFEGDDEGDAPTIDGEAVYDDSKGVDSLDEDGDDWDRDDDLDAMEFEDDVPDDSFKQRP